MSMDGNSILVLGTELCCTGVKSGIWKGRKGKGKRGSSVYGIVLRFGEGGESDLWRWEGAGSIYGCVYGDAREVANGGFWGRWEYSGLLGLSCVGVCRFAGLQ